VTLQDGLWVLPEVPVGPTADNHPGPATGAHQGDAHRITYWDSSQALHDSDIVAGEVRAAAVTKAGVDRNRPPIIDRYEVVLDRPPVKT
jgi:hypothetical protein